MVGVVALTLTPHGIEHNTHDAASRVGHTGPPSLEWLRLTVDPRADNSTTDTSFGPFSSERVAP